MAITINYCGSIFLNVADSARVAGNAALGGYELVFEFSVGVSARAVVGPTELLALFARASVGGLTLGWLVPNFRATLSSAETHAELPLSLVLRLGPGQMEALARQQWPPALELGFVGLANGPRGTKEIFGYGRISVSREDWDRALAQCGYADTVNVWVRIPRSAAAPLRDAGAALALAQTDARQRDRSADAVARCRNALEMAGLTGPGPHVQIGQPPKARKDWTFDERLGLLQFALCAFASPPHHGPADAYGRAEARLAIAITAALLEYEVD
jgi:hypothetical protein